MRYWYCSIFAILQSYIVLLEMGVEIWGKCDKFYGGPTRRDEIHDGRPDCQYVYIPDGQKGEGGLWETSTITAPSRLF